MRTASIAALAWITAAGLAQAQAQSPAQPAADAPQQTVSDESAIRQLPTGHGGPVADDGDHHAGPGRRPGGSRGQLFISPAGEPFRARSSEPYPVAAWFAQANTAHDGKLTRKEFVADAETFFAKLDTDHNGVIDGFENQDYEQKMVPEILPQVGRLNASDAGYGPDAPGVGREAGTNHRRAGYDGPSGGGGGGGNRRPRGPSYDGAAAYSLLNEPQPVSGADFDFNQRITVAEFRRAANERFDLLDKKKRGYLVLAELPKTPVQQMQQQIAEERKKQQKDHDSPPPPAPDDGH